MNLRKFFSSVVFGGAMLFAALPARAGIPVIDVANLANSVQQVIAWGQQYTQMLDQINQLQQQMSQLQTMTSKLEGVRNLGTILNDPSIRAALPPDMRDSTQLLLNPSALTTSTANLQQILASFGVNATAYPTAGTSQADLIGRMQQILAASQGRENQLGQLAQRVNTTSDAKDSMDMMNRNVLEAASVNNQLMQTVASVEAARQAAELRKIADDQAYFARVKAAGQQPLRTYTY